MSSRRLPRVWIVSGPSGSGKTTLVAALLKDKVWGKRLLKSVSYTTRPLRAGEKAGRDYVFVTKAVFDRLARTNGLLEYERIFDHAYGTSARILDDAQKKGRDAVLAIDVKGARTVKKKLGARAVSIFIMPPSPQVLRERLSRRSTEGKKEIEKRLRRVKIETAYAREYDFVVVNDRLSDALAALKAILTVTSSGEPKE
jgi:guanylate kinase